MVPKHVPEYGPLSLLAGAMYRSSCLHEGSVQSKGEDLEDAGTGPAPQAALTLDSYTFYCPF